MKTSEKTGTMVVIKEVVNTDDVVVVTTKGMVIRQHAADIRVAGRNTQGVRLIRLTDTDTIADIAAVVAEEEEEKRLEALEKEKGSVRTAENGAPSEQKTLFGDPQASSKKKARIVPVTIPKTATKGKKETNRPSPPKSGTKPKASATPIKRVKTPVKKRPAAPAKGRRKK
jgi:DNA gyrase/topoisomerase IV subunit A